TGSESLGISMTTLISSGGLRPELTWSRPIYDSVSIRVVWGGDFTPLAVATHKACARATAAPVPGGRQPVVPGGKLRGPRWSGTAGCGPDNGAGGGRSAPGSQSACAPLFPGEGAHAG